jgi:uncharacterized protein
MKHIKNFTRTLLALALTAFLAGPALAQELSPDVLQLARKYIDLTDHGQIFEVAVVQTGIDTLQTLGVLNPGVRDQIKEVIGETISSYKPRKGELMDQFARLYALRFTAEELQQIVAFYESDVGKKLSQENALINQQLSDVLKVFQRNLSVEFVAKVRASLKERGIDV